MSGASGHAVLLVLDIAPPARLRKHDGTPVFQDVQKKAVEILRGLKAGDTVFVARTSPRCSRSFSSQNRSSPNCRHTCCPSQQFPKQRGRRKRTEAFQALNAEVLVLG